LISKTSALARGLALSPYDYLSLFKALLKSPESHEKLWEVSAAFGNKATLVNLAKSLKAQRKKAQQK
jgi:hypothetical protein